MNRISVIIPVYNGERFIKRCYESLKQQTVADWEAVFVNDGSTDRSEQILQEIAAKDNRVRIISRENTGVARAREDGIEAATGEWLTFLDVDDSIEPDAFERIGCYTDKTHPDLLMCGLILVDGAACRPIRYDKATFDFDCLLVKLAGQKLRWSLCGNFYRKELFAGERIPVRTKAAEDCALFVQVASKAKEIRSVDSPFYNYIQEESSASHVKGMAYLEDALTAALLIKDEIKGKCRNPHSVYALDAIVLLNLAVCIKQRLPISNRFARTAVRESFSLKPLKMIPFYKQIPVLIYSLLSKFKR